MVLAGEGKDLTRANLPPDPHPVAHAQRWWQTYASTGPVEVFRVDLSRNPAREAAAWGWLVEEERRRCRRFRHSLPRRQFVLCRAALRVELSSRLGCENRDLTFDLEERAKPFVRKDGVRAPIDFNLSHSGAVGVFALSGQGRVGVDVEEKRTRPSLPGLAGTLFGPDEQQILAGLTGEAWLATFLRFWTIKEALVKAWGTGLHTDFVRFQAPAEILGGGRSGTFHYPLLSAATWQVEDLGDREMALAVVFETSTASGAAGLGKERRNG